MIKYMPVLPGMASGRALPAETGIAKTRRNMQRCRVSHSLILFVHSEPRPTRDCRADVDICRSQTYKAAGQMWTSAAHSLSGRTTRLRLGFSPTIRKTRQAASRLDLQGFRADVDICRAQRNSGYMQTPKFSLPARTAPAHPE
jgi:hypothetical protein